MNVRDDVNQNKFTLPRFLSIVRPKAISEIETEENRDTFSPKVQCFL